MGYIKFSQLPVATTDQVSADDYYAVLDTSENILKRTTADHSSAGSAFGLGTIEKHGHNKLVDNLNANHLISGESLSAHQGNVLANDLGFVEATTSAAHKHAVDDYFILMGQFVHCTHPIEIGDTINIGTNVESTSVGDTLAAFKLAFQAGVDAVYNACVAVGIQPSASTPTAIATAIGVAGSGNAAASDIIAGKTAYCSKALRTGTMANRGAVSQSLNCGASYTIPAGYHNGSGKVTANSLASQTGVDSGKTAVGAGQMLTGYQGWVNGNKITGTMANYSGGSRQTITPSAGTGNQTINLNGGYHDSVIVNRTTVYNSAKADGITQGHDDKRWIILLIEISDYAGTLKLLSVQWKDKDDPDTAYHPLISATIETSGHGSYSENFSLSYTKGLYW